MAARERIPEASPDCFAPRKLYGSHLQNALQTALHSASGDSRFRHHYSLACRLSYDGRIARATLDNGDTIRADKIVLATGNPVPRAPGGAVAGYFGSPWEPGALAGLDSDRDILLVGAGLTAVDALLGLQAQGYRGRVHCLSRHGKLPNVHALYRTLHEPFDASGLTTARGLLRAIRFRVREAENTGRDWRAVVDSLRPVTNEIWCRLENREQRRILRHLKTWWDIHRHRMAPEIGAEVELARTRGRLLVHAGGWFLIAPRVAFFVSRSRCEARYLVRSSFRG